MKVYRYILVDCVYDIMVYTQYSTKIVHPTKITRKWYNNLYFILYCNYLYTQNSNE